MPKRLLTDTCSALKLLALGDKLFQACGLPLGDLIIHPRVIRETNKWDAARRAKYREEFAVLQKLPIAADVVPAQKSLDRQRLIIETTIDEEGLSVGKADIDQLASVICFHLGLVTNDQPFADVASILDVEVFTAEKVVAEALRTNILARDEVKKAQVRWKTNGEKPPSKEDEETIILLLLKP